MRYHRSEIRRAFLTAQRMLRSRNCKGSEVMLVLRPYQDCTEVDGISAQMQNKVIGMIFALIADAHRVDRDFVSAAEWYKKASSHSSTGHAGLYARMVCEHRLAQFYSDALDTVQRQESEWLQRPLLSRMNLRLKMWRLWFDREWLQLRRYKAHDLQFLAENAPKRA